MLTHLLRRHLPVIGAIFALALLLLCPLLNRADTAPTPPAPASRSRPNILFIYSDDHAYQAVGAYGDPRGLNVTPNIDQIGKEGMRFDRCLTTNSLCGPARAVVLTGKYSHLNGFYNNSNCIFDGSQMTFPKLLQQAGYQTAMIGKWHLESNPTGFDYWNILIGQGVYYNPPFIKNGAGTVNTGYVTDLIRDDAIDWLDHRDKSKPFLLMYQNKAPHAPWDPSPAYLNFDNDRKYDPPPTLFDDYSGRGVAEHNQHMTIANVMSNTELKLTEASQGHDAGANPGVESLLRSAQCGPRGGPFAGKRLGDVEI